MKRREMLKTLAYIPSTIGLMGLSLKETKASTPLNASRPYCRPAARQSPFENIIETRIFTVDQSGGGDYISLIDAINDVSKMSRGRQNRIRIVLADDTYYIDDTGAEGLTLPSYTRLQGNLYDKSAVRIIREKTKGRGFEIGAGSILEGVSIIIPPNSSTLPSANDGGLLTEHPVWINQAYPDPGVIQNCYLEGGKDTVIVEGGSIGFMYDVDFTCEFDGIRGGFFSQTLPIRLTMVNCRGIHTRRGNTLIRTKLTGTDNAPSGSLFDIYDCEFIRQPELTKPITGGYNSNLVGPGGEWTENTMTSLIPIRMKNTTCKVIVPATGVSDTGDLATIFMAYKCQFEIDNCSFVIDESSSGAQNIKTMILLDEAEGYALDCSASPSGRVVNNSTLPVFIDPIL